MLVQLRCLLIIHIFELLEELLFLLGIVEALEVVDEVVLLELPNSREDRWLVLLKNGWLVLHKNGWLVLHKICEEVNINSIEIIKVS